MDFKDYLKQFVYLHTANKTTIYTVENHEGDPAILLTGPHFFNFFVGFEREDIREMLRVNPKLYIVDKILQHLEQVNVDEIVNDIWSDTLLADETITMETFWDGVIDDYDSFVLDTQRIKNEILREK